MRRFYALAATVMLALLLSGCASFETTSYKTLGIIGASENAAVRVWKDYAAAPNTTATPEQVAMAKEAHAKFAASYIVAVDALAEYHKQSVKNDAPLKLAMNAVKDTWKDLLNCVVTWLPKDKADKLKAVLP